MMSTYVLDLVQVSMGRILGDGATACDCWWHGTL